MFSLIIQVGVIFLLIFTPFAFGSVHPISYTIMELSVLALVVVWMLRILYFRVKRIFSATAIERQEGQRINTNKYQHSRLFMFISNLFPRFLTSAPYLLCAFIILFLGLICFQMLPLPRLILRTISPKTVELYDFALAGITHSLPRTRQRPQSSSSYRIDKGLLVTSGRTISFYPGNTRTEFYKLLAYVAVFFLIVCNLRKWKQQRAIYVTIILVGTSLALFGIVQKLTWNGKIYWFWESRYGGGPFGPYINKNHFAGYMEMAIPLALSLFVLRGFTNGRTRHRRNGIGNLSPYFFISCSCVIIMTSALCLSLSRGGLISFSVSMLFLTILLLKQGAMRGKIWVIPVILLVAAVTVSWLGGGEILSTWDRTFKRGSEDPSLQQRLHIWSDIIQMWRDFPIFGVGLGVFSDIFPKYSTSRDNVFTAYTESDHFRLLAETGALGILIASLILVAFFTTSVTALRSAAEFRSRNLGRVPKPRLRYDRGSQLRYLLIVGGMTSIVAILAHGWCDFNLFIPANAFLFTIISALTYANSVYHNEELM